MTKSSVRHEILKRRAQSEEEILNDTLNIDARDKIVVLVKKYMDILNVAIQDTTPKYIIMVLVKDVSSRLSRNKRFVLNLML